jgi:transglutaminase-like putative cysteine protease
MSPFEVDNDRDRANTRVRFSSKRKETDPPVEAMGGTAAPLTAPVSVWLYIAGLCVTLSGLYAVNFGADNPTYALFTYLLATCGYITSYVFRLRQVSPQSLYLPLALCMGLLILSVMASDGFGAGSVLSPQDDRQKSLQIILAWLAILHSFTLSSDAAVLFACVPCMTMIALVSSTSTDSEVQNAFLTFVGSATFLMVHENYLRTRTSALLNRSEEGERRLFTEQLLLTGICVVGALVLANFVAVPIRTVGQAILPPNSINALSSGLIRPLSQSQNVLVNERNTIDLATGPVAENATPLLSVRCEKPLLWRGTSFDYYTGNSFESRIKPSVNEAIPDDAEEVDHYQHREIDPYKPARPNSALGRSHFAPERYLTERYELPVAEMRGSHTYRQNVKVLGGTFTQLYGADRILEAFTQFMTLNRVPGGGLITNLPLQANSEYTILSRVANDNPDDLRAVDAKDSPESIKQTYLQIGPNEGQESPRLRSLVTETIKGLDNSYDRVVALQRLVASRCKYNLQTPPAPRNRDAVEFFLFESRQGYCDSFGAALTVLCRYAGIPARLASGFLTGEPDSSGAYIVREKDKHIWTEVFFPHIGWVPFDATDGAEDVTGTSSLNQNKSMSLLTWFRTHGWLPPIIALLLVALLGYLIKTELWDRWRPKRMESSVFLERPATNKEIIGIYLNACTQMERRGLARPPGATPDEYVAMVRRSLGVLLPGIVEPLALLTSQHARYRYGREEATIEEVREAQESAVAIAGILVGVKRGSLGALVLAS